MGLMDKFGMDAAQQAAQQAAAAQQGAAGAGMPGMPGPEEMEMMNRVTKLNASGIEMPATIKSMTKTGKVDAGGGVEYIFGVEVTPSEGSPYGASFNQYMHEGTMGSWASEGAAVNVRVDPDDPSSMILWGGRQ
jgi:hypothetical protein